MTKATILLDTDPGNDIDDAVAIAYLAKKAQCELLGVTTVSGDTAKRAAIAEVVLRAAGREDVPIVAGRNETLLYGQGQPWNAQYAAIEHLPHRLDRKQNEAVDFLRTTIRNRPGEITLVSIGPFQNVALLFALDPEIPMLLKGFVSMAGKFFGDGSPEWNCLIDPVATGMVAKSNRPNHTWFGLDVTLQCAMPAEKVRERFRGELLETVYLMALKWFEHTGKIVFHDPLAVASIFHPELCTYRKGTVRVDPITGRTSLQEGDGPDLVADSVNADAFFDEYFRTVLA